jgi:acetyl-CoA C-acetyltransferase
VYRSPEELIRVGPRNRMIAWPYPKYLNAVLATDQAAALLVTSADAARELGVPRERWIVYRGGAHLAERAWYTSERRDFHSSPALRAAAETALARAEDDPRGFTVTGGLPYAGGPGSSYTLHAVAAMVERLRERPGSGLVTGNGWYLTKHSAAVLASEPGDPAAARPDPPLALPNAVAVAEDLTGPAAIEAYTALFDREGVPNRGIVIGRSDDGRRFLANTPADRAALEALCEGEAVGRRGRVTRPDGLHVFEPE